MATEIHIHLDAGRLNFPLRTIWQGVLSSAVFVVHGTPADIDALGIVFGVASDGTTPHDPPTYRAAATKQADGTWRAYASPFTFPVVGLSLDYSVVGQDSADNPRWLGTGMMNVVDCPAQGSSDAPEYIPRDTYVRDPETGLYHKLIVTKNELGQLSADIDPEGIQR